ncbi:hypothetical protein [Hymenobacter lapidiphilus]|uniref:hypothetical protein n=1 Tax=Hymenobacter sp. CCM 8763 TaxID=2303334 RepID=UPI0011C1329B|nr:hypothetical protein [Hymenobacter sp. CCM 8763]
MRATLLAAVAILCFYYHEFIFGLLALALGLVEAGWRYELTIDTASHRYRFANYILGVSLNSWHPLPTIERIMIVNIRA